MKVYVMLFAVMMACAAGNPQPPTEELSVADRRLVTSVVAGVIETISLFIRRIGLDPINIESRSWNIPIPGIRSSGSVENFEFSGLSNIVINKLRFSGLLTRLTYDIEMPRIALSLGHGKIEASPAGMNLWSEAFGSIIVSKLRWTGYARLGVGLSGIQVRDLDLEFTLGDIESDMVILVQGRDVSGPMNRWLNDMIPGLFEKYGDQINKLLSMAIKYAINSLI